MLDLSTMNFVQLSGLDLAVKAEKQKRRAHEEDALLRDFRERLSTLGLNAEDFAKRLQGGKTAAGKSRAPAAYRDKHDPENTWSGRGRKPLWVVAWLEQGGSMDEITI